jgi:hypothetical protein
MMMTIIDLRYRWVVVAAVAVAMNLGAVGAAHAARGYRSRACGLDMNRNGTIGESADCNVCDGVTKDPDGDGVNEDLIYVNCGAGSDTSSCGTPSNPCKTINYAWNTRGDGPGDGAEDIICFTGVCKTEENIQPGKGGVAGTYTVNASGSQVRAWKYPKNPSMLVGWDKDGDGDYPPQDADDVSVLDGGPNGLDRAFIDTVARSNIEMAHFTVRDYGRTTAATEALGFMSFAATSGDVSSYLYFHDLSLLNINRGKPINSNVIVFNHFRGSINSLAYVGIVNLQCLDCGGYFQRGGLGTGPDISGPFRVQNVSYTGHGCDVSGTNVCPELPEEKSATTFSKLWGWVDGIELLDNYVNANVGNWNPFERGPMTAVAPDNCTQHWAIVNNDFIDWKHAIFIQPDSDNACGNRRMDDVRIDRNTIQNPASPRPYGEITSIELEAGGPGVDETIEDVVLSNNFISSVTGYRACIFSHVGYDSSCTSHGGRITIANNTCAGEVSNAKMGAITIGNKLGTDVRCLHDNYLVKNNVIAGLSGNKNISTTYAPRTWSANNNVFDPSGAYEWNDATTTTLSTWRQASGGDGSSKTCELGLVNRLLGDLHLKSTDTCAIDVGTDLSTFMTVDFDGGVRPAATRGTPGPTNTV